MKPVLALGVLVALAPLLAACGPSNREVLAEYAGRYGEKRTLLATVASSLPGTGSARAGAARKDLDSPPAYSESGGGNTEIVMVRSLTEPDADLRADEDSWSWPDGGGEPGRAPMRSR